MNALDWIAEQKIRETVVAGELNNVPGADKPLNLEGDGSERSTNRLAYTVLKNAGYLPLPLLLRREVEVMMGDAEALLQNCRESSFRLRNKSEPAGACETLNHTVETFRQNYAALLQRINQKITELRNACIRDEILNDLRCAAMLEIPPIDISARLRRFDAESLPDSTTDASPWEKGTSPILKKFRE